MAEATRTGLVESIEVPDKGPGKARVGGRSVRFWSTAYQSSEASDVLELLRQAHRQGNEVTVVGQETTRDGPKGSYTQFMAQSVTISGNGEKPAAAEQAKVFTGREPGLNDYWTGMRHAYSSAIDILGAGQKHPAYFELAQEIFHSLFQAAENIFSPKSETPDEW